MEQGFDMIHGALETSGSHLRVHGAEYASAVQGLLANREASWGDDGLMGPLVAAYSQCKDTALAAFTHMGTVISTTGDAMSAATGRVSYVEDELAGGLVRLDGEPDVTWT
ncbi:hypothetical protein DQ384_13850 [Sphaerisporangium album]|uniref:ESX-1 secretion-associated protein n=1 Tax=Sphaerisporangium album TaxID=509200 RepID=A0A367FKV1_9ACTN|nr:hypothetical protein [Sphaerisporangium album]RCG31023.1 hypothetical protein DQ384_13850 [Sphaerisporangium album]